MGPCLLPPGAEVRVNIPFDFYLEDQLLPTGDYRFQMDCGYHATGSQLVVWGTNGNVNKMLFTVPGTRNNAGLSELSFNKYGDKYFLSTVSIGDHKATVKVFKLERELRSQLNNTPDTIRIAQK
jgi:hypothetical protein